MKQNLQNKRRAFQNQLRNTELTSIFNRLRKKAFGQLASNINRLTLEQIMKTLPKSLPQLFDFVKVNQSQSCQIANYLIGQLPNWINKCLDSVLDIQFWSFLMQILIKLLQNCQNSFQKQMVLTNSEDIVINSGFRLSEQNKTSKYDIFLLVLDYYLVGLTTLQTCKKSKNYIKALFSTFQTLNWRTKGKELIKFVYFCNNLLDLCISQNDRQFFFDLFLQKSTLYISFITVIQQIYQQSCQYQQQNLITLILISLINLTFSLNDRKIYKMVIATDFNVFLLSKLQKNDSFLIQFYLQLTRNLMLDYTQFRAFIRNQVGYLLSYKQTELSLMSEIRQLCNMMEYE